MITTVTVGVGICTVVVFVISSFHLLYYSVAELKSRFSYGIH